MLEIYSFYHLQNTNTPFTAEPTMTSKRFNLLPRSTRVSRYQKNIHSITRYLCVYCTSLMNFLHFVWPMASSSHSCLDWQSYSITSIQVFFGLPLRYYTFHFIIHAFSTHSCPFLKHVHTNLTYVPGSCSTVIISSILSLPQLTTCEPVAWMPHIHLIILIWARWSVKSFSFFTGHVSLPWNIQLCTQLLLLLL